MKAFLLVSSVLGVLLCTTAEAFGQAGRYIPVPPIPSGGGSGPIVPHIPLPHSSGGKGNGDVFWIVVATVALIGLAVVGWKLGRGLAGKKAPPQPRASSIPPLEDLIIQPEEVADKAQKTTRLLEALARRDSAFDPRKLCAFVTATFTWVQECWEKRDYRPVKELLEPDIRAQHEDLLGAMRRNREVNRIENLRVRRLEFVHVHSAVESNRHEVTALITFEAKVYFVHERTEAFLRGSQKVIPYQEFWVFRRQDDGWRLLTIDRSDDSERLHAVNHVDGMTEVDRSNAEQGVIAL
jgi:hypothetical protein